MPARGGSEHVNSVVGADPFAVAGTELSSRLLVGTGKFAAHPVMRAAVLASGTALVTVALRRVDLDRVGDGDILDYVPAGVRLLPNTSGAVTAEEAVRLARLGRAGTGTDWVKLEVTPDPRTLAPDPVETLRAAELLVADGFTVLPYCSADPVLCRRLEEAGCATVMPLGAWIGSNRGLRTRDAIEVIVAQAGVPVVVDAGLGVPSDAAEAMEVGADAVLVNTAIAVARDPVAMARAFALATEAGRLGYRAGRGTVAGATTAEASSPLTDFLGGLTGPSGAPAAAGPTGAPPAGPAGEPAGASRGGDR
jgi:thiazole synthase